MTQNPWSRLAREFGYVLTGLPLCIIAFVVAVAGFSTGLGTLVIWVGLPVLVLTLLACRGLAGAERGSTEWATGSPLPPHHYRPARGSGIRRLLSALADPQSWRDLLHAVVGFPVRLAAFIIAVTWVAAGVGGLSYGIWEAALPRDHTNGLFALITGIRLHGAERWP